MTDVSKLAKALVAFRAEIEPIGFDSSNPHFGNRFASLGAIHRAIDPLMAKHGITIIQFPVTQENRIGVNTILIHDSGQSIQQEFTLPLQKNDPQGGGAAITYARRYAISAALGLVSEEDTDAEAAMDRRSSVRRTPNPRERKNKQLDHLSKSQRDQMKHAASERAKEFESVEEMDIIKDVAQKMGHASPVKMPAAEFEKAFSAIQKWEPGV